MIGFILFLSIIYLYLIILAITNAIRLNKKRKKLWRTPKLSKLHKKEFSKYMDYLTKDL